jgi:Ohr subfamily peroxiredoxin
MSEKVLYTAQATVTGGRFEGHGKTSDGELEVDIRIPKDLGGPGGGTNPEQLFAVGYASCFENAIASVARRRKQDEETSDSSVESKVMLVPTEERSFKLAVALDITLPSIEDPAVAKELVEGAHKVCPYSNATRGNIDVTLTVNGQPVG